MDDATSLTNTIGPMALPVLFVLFPIGLAFVGGIGINAVYNLNPPLIFGFNPSWATVPPLYMLETWYWVRQWKAATKASWLTMRYWAGNSKRHFDNDFILDHWQPLGRASKKVANLDGKVVETFGLETVQYGFITKPRLMLKKPGITCTKTHYWPGVELPDDADKNKCCNEPDHFYDAAGEMLYECHQRSNRFPVWIAALPDLPERMFTSDGNMGIVIKGGLMFEVEHIAAFSFVRCDFIKTELLDFVPVGVITDCAMIAADVAEQRMVTYAGKQAVQVAAKARDVYYSNDYLRKWKDAEKELEITNAQEHNMEKTIERRSTAQAKATFAIQGGIKPPTSGGGVPRSRGWLPWVVAVSIIVAAIIIPLILLRA